MRALIVRSLRQSTKADVVVKSAPGQGLEVTIDFSRVDAAPQIEV